MSIEEIREKYGDEVADKIEEEIKFANTNEYPFSIYVDQDRELIHQVYFATSYIAKVYEVSTRRKSLMGERTIYYVESKKANELMKALQQAE